MVASDGYVTNLNYALKGIKSDTIIDFIQVDYRNLIMTANKVAFSFDLSIVGNYVKGINIIDLKILTHLSTLVWLKSLLNLSISLIISRLLQNLMLSKSHTS